MFQNSEIVIDDLPTMENLEWQQLHPKFLRRIQAQKTLVALVFLAGLTILTVLLKIPLLQTVLLWLLVGSVAIVYVAWPIIAVPRRGYVVRHKDIVFRSGVVWRSVTAVPFNRVQHVETSSTPLDRKFGLTKLEIFTAGGVGGDLTISGLGADIAEQLRVYILGKVGARVESA